MSTQLTQESLLERARARDQQAWHALVELYSPLVVRWCQRLRISPEATADCIQEVFTAVARSLDTYHPPGTAGAFRGWLWTVTRNKLRDAARRNRGQLPAAGGSTALAQLHLIPEVNAELVDERTELPSSADDDAELMRRAIAQIESSFAPKTWRAFWRTVIDGLPTEMVAIELELTPAAVRQARSRIMRRLRQQLLDL